MQWDVKIFFLGSPNFVIIAFATKAFCKLEYDFLVTSFKDSGIIYITDSGIAVVKIALSALIWHLVEQSAISANTFASTKSFLLDKKKFKIKPFCFPAFWEQSLEEF